MKALPLKTLILTFSLLTASLTTYSAATRFAYLDTFATSRGNAFTATANNPSAVFYNAAGLTQLDGTQIISSVYLFSGAYEYSGAFGDARGNDDIQPVPTLFISHTQKDQPISFGFGIYTPFALGTDWGKNAPFALVDYESEIVYTKYHGVIAWKLTDTLSVSVGASYDHATIDLKSALPANSFEGSDNTIGFSASLLWQPSAEHSFGINYQAASSLSFKGKNSGLSTTGDLEFPDSIVIGYSWRPDPTWNIEFNLDWTNWDKVNDLVFSNAFLTVPVPLDWESSFIYELGATKYLEGGWNASAGYTFVENSIPDTTFNPVVPDVNRHIWHIGLGRKYDHFSWQFAYQYVHPSKRNVSGNTNILPDGEYILKSQAISLSFAYAF